jgi:hypothetical protein
MPYRSGSGKGGKPTPRTAQRNRKKHRPKTTNFNAGRFSFYQPAQRIDVRPNQAEFAVQSAFSPIEVRGLHRGQRSSDESKSTAGALRFPAFRLRRCPRQRPRPGLWRITPILAITTTQPTRGRGRSLTSTGGKLQPLSNCYATWELKETLGDYTAPTIAAILVLSVPGTESERIWAGRV